MKCIFSKCDKGSDSLANLLYISFQNTQAEWRNVFYVCAGFCMFGIIIFGLFATGELQEWAKDPEDDVEFTVQPPEKKPGSENEQNHSKQ